MASFGIIHWLVVLGVIAFWIGVFVLVARYLKRRG